MINKHLLRKRVGAFIMQKFKEGDKIGRIN